VLVVSRQVGDSIFLGGAQWNCLVTVTEISLLNQQVGLLVAHAKASRAGQLDCGNLELGMNQWIRVGEVAISVVHILEGKARLGIVAPAEVTVHRLEVWEQIRQTGDKGWQEGDEGFEGPPVVR
jgi:carbon storage regulator CsrA